MPKLITPNEVAQWIIGHGNGVKPLVLDVREPHEVQYASIKAPEGCDLIHIPMGVIPPRLTELDAKRPIACLCHHGGRSMQVANFLESKGFSDVANIVGGINAWSLQVDPTIPRY